MALSHSRFVAIWLCCLVLGATAACGDGPLDGRSRLAGDARSAAPTNRPTAGRPRSPAPMPSSGPTPSPGSAPSPGSVAAASAQPSAASPQTPQHQSNPSLTTNGQSLLRQARAALERHKTISATIHQRIHLYGQELVGSGILVQGPTERNLLQVDLTVKIDGRDLYVQQRCDGEYYWLQKCIDGVPRLSRVDLRRVEAARAVHAKTHAANGTQPLGAKSLPMLGLGGMATLLDQLDLWCIFSKVRQTRPRGPNETPLYVLEGTWRPERLLFWLPDQREAVEKGQPVNISKLPPMLPDRIVVFLGWDDLFPRRIEYSASESRTFAEDEAPPLVRVHFEDVQFDLPVDPRQFMFDSPVVSPVDDTEGYLLRHGWQ